MKKSFKNDIILRKKFQENEIDYILLRFLMDSNCFGNNLNYKVLRIRTWRKKMERQFKKNSISKKRNHCLLSYNTMSVHRKVQLSRWEFKKQASFGRLTGWRKSSW